MKLTVKIEKPVYGGYGLAFHEKKALFIENALPGEEVEIRIYNEKKDHAFGRIEKIISPSPRRQASPCPAFPACGGCSYLCVDYEEEINYKKAIVGDSLRRICGMPAEDIPEIEIITGDRFHYRSHAGIKSDGRACGFYRKETNSLEPFPEQGCLLLAGELNDHIRNLECTCNFDIAIDSKGKIVTSMDRDTSLIEMEKGITYSRKLDNFFQANRFLRSQMLERVSLYAGLSPTETFLDIACGVGFFSLYLAGQAKTGHGVDISRLSIKSALENARINGIDNLTFSAMPASMINPARLICDTVILDPPRTGLDKKTRHTINAIEARRIVYVSCNPATFARDARDFIKGGYTLRELTLIDMFPGTHHIELVSHLQNYHILRDDT